VFEALRRTVPYAAVAIVYVALRLNAIGFHMVAPSEILSNPYLYATVDQALATKLAVLLRYAALLVFPYPLSSDYSYRQIPYVDFSSLLPWLSLVVHGAVLAWGVLLLRRRDIRAFAVFFYLGTLAIVSNVIIDIGAFMGERLVYHASLGFVLIVAWAALALARRAGFEVAAAASARTAGITLVVVSAVVMLAASAWTVERNSDWKNDFTLFTRDVVTGPNSAVLNANASLYFLAEAEKPQNAGRREALLKSAIAHLEKAIEIHPKFASAHINLGLALFRLDRLDDAEREWRLADKLRARDPVVAKNLVALGQTYFNRGLDDGSNGRFEPALALFDKAVRLDPGNAAIWTNIGKSRYWLKDYAGAREAWEHALKLEPGRRDAVSGLAALGSK
jgi:tetratricopeptide (TPR) repeat protein